MKNEEIEKLNFSGWPLPDNYLVEIGRVSALWASLEALLNMCISKLAGFDNLNDSTPFILINHSSFPQRLDMLSTLCEQLQKDYKQLVGYKDVVSQIKAAQNKRNIYAHNGMFYNQETGKAEMAIGSARGKLKVAVNTIEIADIRRATIEIDEANNALYKLVLNADYGPARNRVNA